MARGLDLSKAKKGELADYLAKKLSRDDLQTVAQHVQDGTFNAEMLRGAAEPSEPVFPAEARPDGVLVDHTDGSVVPDLGVTPADTTASLSEHDES